MQSLKTLLRQVSPKLYSSLQELWTNYRLAKVFKAIVDRFGLTVQAGPFAGMSYISQAVGSTLSPKLIGCYEEELHGALATVTAAQYDAIIDVGCAEGYYAVGLALQFPESHVYAFDIDTTAQRLCRELALANGVADRVSVSGECSLEQLVSLTSGRALCVLDCEGCELELLRPDLIPGLRTSDILVELHDFINPITTETIKARFSTTHEVEIISEKSRDDRSYPALHFLHASDRRLAMAEFRPDDMKWAFIRPRVSSAE